MIKRYMPKDVGRIWTLRSKFEHWLRVELAVIKARCERGDYPDEVYGKIRSKARLKVSMIKAIDKVIHHDLQAFVQNVRSFLPKTLRHFFHDRMTSYDTEEPALALQLLKVGNIILEELDNLAEALRKRASEHMWTFCMAITHGQDAKPNTLGWKLCNYLEAIVRSKDNFERILEQIQEVKLSGATGNYLTIDPDLEEEVLKILGLKRRPAATQIVMRDAIARLMCEIAITGGVIEKIAVDLRKRAETPVLEIQEPRDKRQKGSSAMPHKKNPIVLERISGQARNLRGNALVAIENIATWEERDISQSAPERIILPDSTGLLVYMLRKLTWVIENMPVFPERMAENIGRTYGCWASEEVKNLLCDQGFDTEKVYELVQAAAFKAMKERRPFKEIILKSRFSPGGKTVRQLVPKKEIDQCFEFRSRLLEILPSVYARFNLDSSLALPPNI